MSFRQYLIIMVVVTLVCWAAWGWVLWRVDPSAGTIGLVMFYVTLFFSVLTTFSIIGIFIRYLFFREEMEFYRVRTAFRQALWLAILVVVAGIFQHLKLLTWWNILIFVGALAVLEYFFVSFENVEED